MYGVNQVAGQASCRLYLLENNMYHLPKTFFMLRATK